MAQFASRRSGRVIALRSMFSPLAFVVFLYAPLLLFYAVASETVFAQEFDSRKALTWTGFAYFALALLCFATGAKAGDDGARANELSVGRAGADPGPTPSQRRSLAVLVEATLVLCVLAYVVWFALGVSRAGGLISLIEIWRVDPHRIKAEILTTVPGATTLTQLAVASIALAVAFNLFRRGSAIRLLVIVVFALAAFRAVLANERLALLELLLPIVFLVAGPRKVTVPRAAVYGLALLVAAITFFSVTELRRTYAYTNDFSASRSTTRFFGYYLTSINNGMVVVDEYPARTPLYSSGEVLWRFPGVRDLRVEHLPAVDTLSLRYADAFDVDPERFWPRAFAAQGLDYEFNVLSAPGYLAADFGWAALGAVFVLGFISGRLYRRSESSAFHRSLYAVWLVGMFEFMRILYFTNTRVFPAYLVFLAAYLIVRRRAPRGALLTSSVSDVPSPPGRIAG